MKLRAAILSLLLGWLVYVAVYGAWLSAADQLTSYPAPFRSTTALARCKEALAGCETALVRYGSLSIWRTALFWPLAAATLVLVPFGIRALDPTRLTWRPMLFRRPVLSWGVILLLVFSLGSYVGYRWGLLSIVYDVFPDALLTPSETRDPPRFR